MSDSIKKTKKEEATDRQESKNDIEAEMLKKQIEDATNNYKRALADYQNLQKRADQERQDWIRITNKELILRLLPVLDTLMLADKHADNKDIKVIMNQFIDILKSEGVTRVDAAGKKFDPHLMEVVETVDGDDGVVVEELRSGYTIHDKLLRASQVRVGKKQN